MAKFKKGMVVVHRPYNERYTRFGKIDRVYYLAKQVHYDVIWDELPGQIFVHTERYINIEIKYNGMLLLNNDKEALIFKLNRPKKPERA
jgi:hypothetical protein